MFKPGVHVEAHSLPAIYAMLLRYTQYSGIETKGVVISMDGNISDFAPFDDWDGQLKQMLGGDESARDPFFTKLRLSIFMSPMTPDGKGLSLLSTQHGQLFIPAFTASAEFRKWEKSEDGATIRSFEVLCGIVTDDPKLAGIVINPFGNQLVLTRQDLTGIENAATGMTHERVEHRGKLILETTEYTAKLARAFADSLKSSELEVFEAYILSARGENEKTPHLLFLMDFNGDRKLLFPAVARAVQPHMKTGTNFELLKASFETLDAARKKASPVYTRK
jgi:hypothetical protein